MKDPVNLAEFRGAYLAEVEELLGAINQQLLAVEAASRRGERHVKGVRELFRAVHTIKGLSAMVGVEPIVVITHKLESALRAADRSGGRLASQAVDILLQAIRAVEQRVRQVADGKAVANAPEGLLDTLDALEARREARPRAQTAAAAAAATELPSELRARLTTADEEQLARGVAEGRRAVRIDFTPTPERAERGVNITAVRGRMARLGEIVKVLPLSVPTSGEAPGGLTFALVLLTSAADSDLAAAAERAPENVQTLLAPRTIAIAIENEEAALAPLEEIPDVAPLHHSVVRVEVGRLDEAMERLSALIVTRFRLARAVAELQASGANVRELQVVMTENARQLRDLRAAILRLRMVPIAEMLGRLPLLVRGIKRATGKQVRLELSAGGAEVDKGVGERIFPALVHLVRNAADHAIEPPGERARAGKAEEGTITITSVERSNTQIEIVVRDDGAGIDREKLAARAGRPVPDSDEALLELLCLPGLSSRDQADATSGRGMGMDIVKRIVVDQLGGELQVHSERGQGTTFTLRVPLTISIVDAFTFEAGAQKFVVPVSMVEEIVDVDAARLVDAPSPSGQRGARLIERRGQAVPLVRLDGLLGRSPKPIEARKALIVRRHGEAVAFGVDRMVAQQEVVVRPLEDPLVKVAGVSGATDLGDGQPTLVLDLPSLMMGTQP